MSEKVLFSLEDIKPQLTEEQIKEIEHIIYMAKETKDFQKCRIGDYGKWIVVVPSGKLFFQPEENKCII